jgi:hypothetical protein
MLCFLGKNLQRRVQQIKLLTPPLSNADFFRTLKSYYDQYREPGAWGFTPFWREVKSIHYVQFITLGTESTASRGIRLTNLHIRPAPQKDWIRAERIVAPPSSYNLKQWLYNPSEAGESLGARGEFAQIPRKAHGQIPPEPGHVGYGLYLHEGTSESVLGRGILYQLCAIGFTILLFPGSTPWIAIAGLFGIAMYFCACIIFYITQDVQPWDLVWWECMESSVDISLLV